MDSRTRRSCLALVVPVVLLQWGCSKPEAPAEYRVRLETSRGDVVIEVVRAWSPLGSDRFHELVQAGFYDGARFFRVLPGFVVQFGMSADPAMNAEWADKNIPDDPPARSNTQGTVSFATAGPNTRSTQVFINLGNNTMLDAQGFTPFGRVIEGMSAVAQFHAGYGEGPPMGTGPDQGRMRLEGNAYLEESFPMLDHIRSATIVR